MLKKGITLTASTHLRLRTDLEQTNMTVIGGRQTLDSYQGDDYTY
jgi:hypothetical protein